MKLKKVKKLYPIEASYKTANTASEQTSLLSKVSFFLCNSYQVVITGLFWVILLILTVMAAFSTSQLPYANEFTYYITDSVWWNLFFLFLTVGILILLKRLSVVKHFFKQIREDETLFFKYRKRMLWLLFGISVFWILATQFRTWADAWLIQDAVYGLHLKDYSYFVSGGYLESYSNQWGLTWITWLLSVFFGDFNALVFQLLNAAGLVLFYYCLSEICEFLNFGRVVQLTVILCGFLFFPLIMYTSFVYGTMFGLAFSVVAIRNEIAFFQRQKLRYIFFSAIFIALAIMFKSNAAIFMIGILISAVIEVIRAKKISLFTFVLAIIIFCFAESSLITNVSRFVSKQPLNQGISAWSFIAMGLQYSDKGGPGWWNNYNNSSYEESDYQTDIQAELAKKSIKESIEYFEENPQEIFSFFTQKIALQWNNPTFQSFELMQVFDTSLVKADWLWYFLSAQGEDFFSGFLNIFQFLILIGSLIYMLLYKKNENYRMSLVFGLIFIGGFIFHFFWEAKPMYTIPYFVLLFPYAVAGYDKLTDKLIYIFQRKKHSRKSSIKSFRPDSTVIGFWVLSAVTLVSIVLLSNNWQLLSCITADDEAYRTYLAENDITPKLSDGKYYFHTTSGLVLNMNINQMPDENSYELYLTPEKDQSAIRVANYQGRTRLSFSEKQYLTIYDSDNPDIQLLKAAPSTRWDDQSWTIKEAENGCIYILHNGDRALTFDEATQTIFVSAFTGESNQQWLAVKETDN